MKALKKVMIFYDWFMPAYKAGGPIAAIANLVRNTSNSYRYYIVCRNTEYGSGETLPIIAFDEWVDFEGHASVCYLPVEKLKLKRIKELIREVDPDVTVVNGMYSLYFSLIPALYSKKRTVVSVIGMMHPGALSQKSWKKKAFIFVLRLLLKQKKIVFHATDQTEQEHIKNVLGRGVQVLIAGCFPNIFDYAVPLPKKGSTILGSIALISPMKNHHLVLEALKTCTGFISYKIFGPIKDSGYWKICEQIIKELPSNISVFYEGEISPAMVPGKLSGIHYFILPSKSENFGYAFIEALSIGRPVITSHFTPWNNLAKLKAGYNIDISNSSDIKNAIEKCSQQEDVDYGVWSRASRDYAIANTNFNLLNHQYEQLFSA